MNPFATLFNTISKSGVLDRPVRRQRELDARKKTNKAHTSRTDAAAQAQADAYVPVGTDSIQSRPARKVTTSFSAPEAASRTGSISGRRAVPASRGYYDEERMAERRIKQYDRASRASRGLGWRY